MRILPVTLALLLTCAGASAQTISSTPPAAASSITTLQTVTVTGVVPGPGLWKVTRGDHVLWILGVVPTLPAGIEWRSAQVAQTIAASQAVLDTPGVKLKVDTNWFGKLFLLPTLYRAQRNPDGKTLHDVLPPATYARWYYVRQRYFGDDYSVERYRPIVAAWKLMKQAMKANGLRNDGEVTGAVAAMAKQHGVKVVKPETTLEIKEPRQAVKAFAASNLDGIACLDVVLDAIEHELPNFRARANAWATGDIDTLRKVPEARIATPAAPRSPARDSPRHSASTTCPCAWKARGWRPRTPRLHPARKASPCCRCTSCSTRMVISLRCKHAATR